MSALQLSATTVNAPPNATTGSVTLTFNANVSLAPFALDPNNWSIINNSTNFPLPIISISYDNADVTLITNEQDTNTNYTINIPQIGISRSFNRFFINCSLYHYIFRTRFWSYYFIQ